MRRRDFLVRSLAGASALGIGATRKPDRSKTPVPSSDDPDFASISIHDLRCEYSVNPLGIDALRPRLSWKLKVDDGARGQVQSAYHITAASTEALLETGVADVWDSGRVESPRQLHVEYAGEPLTSGIRVFWRVQVWDADGRISEPSVISWWEMGLLSREDWKAVWISDGKALPETDEGFYEDDPAPLLRRSFRLDKPIKRARLYAAGLGYYDLIFNGLPVSDRVLDPAWTSFEKRVYYSCHDLTERIIEGENVLGVMLGNGWFNPLPLKMWGRINPRDHLPVGRPRLMAQLHIEYRDGSTQTIASDQTWKVSEGPIIGNSVFLGEKYDARLEQPGWDRAGFDDAGWIDASLADSHESQPQLGELRACPVPPIRITKKLSPVSVNEVEPGVHIFDLGQNFAGWVRLRVQGPRGTTVQMRMGERVYPDGTLNPMTAVAGQIKGVREDGTHRGGPGSPEIAWQANTYTLRGNGREQYTPQFTFHGFRYVEVTGFPGTPTLDAIEGLRLNTDVESSGSFSCSNDRLTRIQEMTQWTLLSNLFSVQSDCPAREKFQYGGDIVASSEMAILNFNMATFYGKTASDYRDAVRGDGWFTETAPYVGISAANYAAEAGPIGWGLAHPLLLAQLYQYYGDKRIIEEHFDTARKWVDLLVEHSDGFIIDRCIGDHESLDPKPIELVATAQFYQATSMIEGFAKILGRSEEAETYRRLALTIKKAFVKRFLDPATGRFGIATQASQATALYMGLAPESEVGMATRRMVEAVLIDHDGHIATGIFGTKYLLNALSATGHSDVAYQMVDKRTFPGWGYMLEKGATTIWETWAESDNVYSQNHPMFGSVSEWFFKCLGGIAPDDNAVGFDHFRITPSIPADLKWVNVTHESVRGTIKSHWRIEGGLVHLDVEIPVNSTAVVELPTSDPTSLREGGLSLAEVTSIRTLHDSGSTAVRLAVGSGRYSFTALAP